MQRSRTRLVSALAATLLGFALSSEVLADERTDAARQFRTGMRLVSERKYDEGIEHLQRAYEILPHPNVLYNIARAHQQAGRLEQALDYFLRYQDEVSPAEAVEIESQISAIRQQLQQAPPPPPTTPPPGQGVDPARTLETTSEELRRLAEAQNDPALRAQAEEVQRLRAKLREQETGVPTSAVEAPAAPRTSEAPSQPTPIVEQTPPLGPSEEPAITATAYRERVFSASRFAQSPLDAPNATAIITAQDIRMAGVTQLSQLLRRVAGVEVSTVAPYHAEISIRGLNRRSSNKVLLLWDGRPMRQDFMGTSWIDMVPILIDDIERIEIIRGPASALYGADAFSGVINIITRAPAEGGSFVVGRMGNRGQAQTGATISGRSGELLYRGSTFYTQAYDSVEVASPDRIDIVRAKQDKRSYQSFAVNGDLSYPYARTGAVSAGGSYNAFDATVQGLSRLGQVFTRDSVMGQLYGTLTTPVGIRVGSSYNYVSGHPSASFFAPGAIGDQPAFIRQRIYDLDVSWSGKFDLLLPQTFTIGTNYRYKQIEWDWLDDKHAQHHVGVYLQDAIQLAEPLRLQIGARIDRHPLLESVQFSPRASLVYRFLSEQSLRLSAGRAFRSPSFLESYLNLPNETPVRGVTAYGKGNDKLDPESIVSLEVGYQNQALDYLALELNVYYNWVKDAILLTDIDTFTLRDFAGGNRAAQYDVASQAFPVSNLSYANERATYRQVGGELGVRLFPVEGLDVYVNYALHDTAPVDKGKVDPARAREQQTSLHKVNAGIQYRAWFGLEAALDASWVSKQLWIEQVTDVASGVRWQEYPQSAFVMLNARLGFRLLRDHLELGVVGTNLASDGKRQHPLAQTLDTRVLGTAKVRF